MMFAIMETIRAIFLPPSPYPRLIEKAPIMAHIETIKGDVQVRRNGQSSWRSMSEESRTLYKGDRLFVNKSSHIIFKHLNDDAVVQLSNFAFYDIREKVEDNLNLLKGVQSSDSFVEAQMPQEAREDLNAFAQVNNSSPNSKAGEFGNNQSIIVSRPSKTVSAVFPEGKFIAYTKSFPFEVPVVVNAQNEEERLYSVLWSLSKDRTATWSGVSASETSSLCRNSFCYVTKVQVSAPGVYVLSSRTMSQRLKVKPIYIEVQENKSVDILPIVLKPKDVVMIP